MINFMLSSKVLKRRCYYYTMHKLLTEVPILSLNTRSSSTKVWITSFTDWLITPFLGPNFSSSLSWNNKELKNVILIRSYCRNKYTVNKKNVICPPVVIERCWTYSATCVLFMDHEGQKEQDKNNYIWKEFGGWGRVRFILEDIKTDTTRISWSLRYLQYYTGEDN